MEGGEIILFIFSFPILFVSESDSDIEIFSFPVLLFSQLETHINHQVFHHSSPPLFKFVW